LKEFKMSIETNKAIVGRWFTNFWGPTCDLDIVDELAAPDRLLQYSLHAPRRRHADIKAFMSGFRKAFPDLNFWGTADLSAEGDWPLGRRRNAYRGGLRGCPGWHASSSHWPEDGKMHFSGTTVLRVKDSKITQEIGLDDGVTALKQLRLIREIGWPA
jgi:hypothetical protein